MIPRSTYHGMDADNKQATVMNILVANENMERQDRLQHRQDDLRQAADLIAVHKEAENFKLENQKAGGNADPVPSRAVKYFTEKGIKL